MNSLILSVLLLCSVAYVANAQGQYTSRYDNINLDEILASKRLIGNYVACLLGTKSCSPEGAELKKVLPDALQTKCAKCNDKQKEGALKVIQTLQKDYPAEWAKLQSKWDPTGEYFRAFEAEIRSGRLKVGKQ